MNTKRSKGITGITLAFIMIASIFAAITPAPVAAAVTVDGVITGTEWDTPLIEVVDTVDAAGTAPPGYNLTEVKATIEGTTLYCLMIVDGVAGDADGNGDPDTTSPTDYPGIGAGATFGWEEYTFYIDADNDGNNDYWLRYTQGATLLTDPSLSPDLGASTAGAFSGSVIEVSLANAGSWINVDDFCVAGAADTDFTGAEDYSEKVCYTRELKPPSFNLTWEGVGCFEVQFTGTYTVDPGLAIANHTWDFGDGHDSGVIAGPPGVITHLYDTCGPKVVKLSGYDTDGAYNFSQEPIYVDCGPTASAVALPAACYDYNGSMITFDGSASHADLANTYYPRNITEWQWTFSDGLTGDNDNGAITKRIVNDTITATLWVSDGWCNDTFDIPVVPCAKCLIRIYGTFDMGPGDHDVPDPETGLKPENPPYTDPVGPFHPQHPQAPRKDFITFNPAIMDHNQAPPGSDDKYDELAFAFCEGGTVQRPMEKVFKRMWYEKEWFKDHNRDGCFTVVIDKWNKDKGEYEFYQTMCLDDWNKIPQHQKQGLQIREWNNDERVSDSNCDIYGPAILQEFTYMTLDGEKMPILVSHGSEVLIPMASYVADNGIDSFDADGDGKRDALRVESEFTLGIDIDGDGLPLEHMDQDLVELSQDESVVLVLGNKQLTKGKTLQFFDHKLTLDEIDDDEVIFTVADNEGGGSTRSTTVAMKEGDYRFFYRGKLGTVQEPAVFYVYLDKNVGGVATIEVGRMFGQTAANIGANKYWNQKAFMVDGVFYNVVAIKALDDCFKYITFRQKLPKMPIKLFGKHLTVWDPKEILPEMPPFNEPHEVMPDIETTWTKPNSQQDKIPDEKAPRPALEIDYVYEGVEKRYKGELKEIYNESHEQGWINEYWNLEWFHTKPWQYTEFRLPKGDRYLVTLGWIAPESEITLWDDAPGPVAEYVGERFKFWYEDCTGPLYIDANTSSIRIYGSFDEGPGDHKATDPENGLRPENPPYTDPVGPFHPQHPQAPVKDFMTFNPAIMDHNQGYPQLDFAFCEGHDVQRPKEKVFKRMWYEKEWFKDHYNDGCFTVIVQKWNKETKKYDDYMPMCLDDWNKMTQAEKFANGLQLKEWNNDESAFDSGADIYAPAINQEFTYMALDGETMPILVSAGSKVLIPMASYVADNGIDSFDANADDDTVRDAVRVESENTLGMDIDGDGIEPMDADNVELSGDETVVLVLSTKLIDGQTLQFFDHKVKLIGHDDDEALYEVSDNEGGGSTTTTGVTMKEGDVLFFYRGKLGSAQEPATFYVKQTGIVGSIVTLEVGRMFGQTYANIAANPYWNQKAFMVDGVFYNVVAIKAVDDCFKFITFRQKLPKEEIKLFGKHLEVWEEGEILPEMPPFNENHEIIDDIQTTWTVPKAQQDKIGDKIEDVPPLEITFVEEDKEKRFKGQLLEIYNETHEIGWLNEYWNLEWFHTQPDQYTAFVMPTGHKLYLMTLAWYAPQAEITLWDDAPGPVAYYKGERVKFWYDPAVPTDIYVNRVGEGGGAPADPTTLWEYYDLASNDGDGQGDMDADEVISALMDYLTDMGPFAGPSPKFTKSDLISYILDFLAPL
jgi:hypothetical protein